MSQYGDQRQITLEAGADLSSHQYHFVKRGTGENDMVAAAAATDKILGILQDAPESGDVGAVATAGRSKLVAAGSISIGDYLTSDADAEALVTTTAGDVVRAIALEEADAGDIFEVEMVYFHHKA